MKRKNVASLITTIWVLALVLGLGGNVVAADLTVGVSDWPVWETARGMAALNKADGFKIKYEKYGTVIGGFSSNKLDLAFMTLYDFIATQRDSANGVIIAATDYSSGGDGVVLRGEISSAKDLKGKTLGLQADAISLYMAHLYLKKSGLSLDDVKISNVKGEQVSKAFKANKRLAGIVGWNPNLDDGLKAGGKLAASSADFPETIFDVIVVNRKSLAENKQAYQDFLNNWFASVNDPATIKKCAELIGVSEDEFKGWREDAAIFNDKAASLKAFSRMKTVAKEVQAFFGKKPAGLGGSAAKLFGDKAVDIEALFDDSLLK